MVKGRLWERHSCGLLCCDFSVSSPECDFPSERFFDSFSKNTICSQFNVDLVTSSTKYNITTNMLCRRLTWCPLRAKTSKGLFFVLIFIKQHQAAKRKQRKTRDTPFGIQVSIMSSGSKVFRSSILLFCRRRRRRRCRRRRRRRR